MVTFSSFPKTILVFGIGASLVAGLLAPGTAVAQPSSETGETGESGRWIDPVKAEPADGDNTGGHEADGVAEKESVSDAVSDVSDAAAEGATGTQAAPAAKKRSKHRLRLHHAPPSVGRAHEPLLLRGVIEYPQLARRVVVAFRTTGSDAFHEVEFKRGPQGPYVAVIPAEDVRWPYVEYTVEIEAKDGTRRTVFASREVPFRVEVPEDLGDMRERALLERLEGRRSTVRATAEYVSFGSTTVVDRSSGSPQTSRIDDSYYRAEGSYTYRPLRIVTQFGLRAGVVRGKAPTGAAAAEERPAAERYDVGLNYGAPHVQFRIADVIHWNVEFLTSVTETGFSLGGGSAVVLGDPFGSRLTVGFESIQKFGTRFFSRMDMDATEDLSFAPIVEITNMPNATKYGVRLMGEATINLGDGMSLALRGGYQARDFTSGGPSGGASLAYSF